MATFLLMICVLIALVAASIIVIKIQKKQRFLKRQKKETELQVQSAQMTTQIESDAQVERVIEIDAYEQVLFDDVASLFLDQAILLSAEEDAELMQSTLLVKMPAKTQTQIRKMDLNEWSIFWSFYDQSLEYYVSRYGMFYTHIDRSGREHKKSHRTRD
ncbi:MULTISPECIES: hypothetical protein [unclassified Acinetobacter]|uniref:hypothetical protein n=1 Tax=unclassified Acinetobacter TaxID=196816 RepID=UPI00148A3143|nr:MULTISPECIES: hypothetical protein [unclassified Acinetobacter]